MARDTIKNNGTSGNENEALNDVKFTSKQALFKVLLRNLYIWLYKGNQYEFRKLPKIKWLDGGIESMLMELVLISFIKPDVRKTLNINISGYVNNITIEL